MSLRLTIYHRRRLKIRLLTMLLLLINRLLLMILLLLKILLLLRILLLLLLLLLRILLLLLLLLLLKKRAGLRKRFRLEDVAVRLYLLRPRRVHKRSGRAKPYGVAGLLHASVVIAIIGHVEGNARRQRSADTVRRTRG